MRRIPSRYQFETLYTSRRINRVAHPVRAPLPHYAINNQLRPYQLARLERNHIAPIIVTRLPIRKHLPILRRTLNLYRVVVPRLSSQVLFSKLCPIARLIRDNPNIIVLSNYRSIIHLTHQILGELIRPPLIVVPLQVHLIAARIVRVLQKHRLVRIRHLGITRARP